MIWLRQYCSDGSAKFAIILDNDRANARDRRAALFGKWHVLMPLLTTVFGYFPGKRLGWLEDLPAGVAHAWSFGGPRFESRWRRGEGSELRDRMAAFRAPILAVAVSDDELGTPQAIRRTLDYYEGAPRTTVLLRRSDFGRQATGHFNLFHDSQADGFWQDTISWLTSGVNP